MDWGSLTIQDCLIKLKAFSHWYHLVKSQPKYLPATNVLKVGFSSALKGFQYNRKNSVRVSRMQKCVVCGAALQGVGSGDHIIPRSWFVKYNVNDDFDGVWNYIPMCRRCNSRKHTLEFLQFWVLKLNRKIYELDPDVLVQVLRANYRYALKANLLSKPATLVLQTGCNQAYVYLGQFSWRLQEIFLGGDLNAD